MAIKISTTEVIDSSRVLQNIAGANGVCNNFHATAVAITTVLNFALPVMSLTMSGPVIFTESNKLLGRSALLLLDTSSSAFTPTFSADIRWQNGVTPTWGNYRYWQIALQCVNVFTEGTKVRGIALGYEFTGSAPPVTETITLSGFPGLGYNATVTQREGGVSSAFWYFNSNGTVYRSAPDSPSPDVQFRAGIEWCDVVPSQTYYIRCTLMSSFYSTGSFHLGTSFNIWHPLTSDRLFGVNDATLGGASSNETYKIEIANDAAGSNILATGYYNAWASSISNTFQ